MSDKEILNNAPEGATHVDNNGFYLKAGKSGFMEPDDSGVDWDYDCASHSEVRALIDIRRIAELEIERVKLISCLSDISNACIGKIAMSYDLDAEWIGQSIYATTGMTAPEMDAYLKDIVSLNP